MTPESVVLTIMIGFIVIGLVAFSTVSSWISMITPENAGGLIIVFMIGLFGLKVLGDHVFH